MYKNWKLHNESVAEIYKVLTKIRRLMLHAKRLDLRKSSIILINFGCFSLDEFVPQVLKKKSQNFV